MASTEHSAATAVVVLLSGGLDSVTLLHAMHRTRGVRLALSFAYGAKHNRREQACAAWQADRLGVPRVTVPLQDAFRHFHSALLCGGEPIPDGHYAEASMRQTVVPFRNGIFLSVAAGVAESVGAQALAIAAHSGDHAVYPDCRPDFMAAMRRAIATGTYAALDLLCPFQTLVKAAIVRRGHDLGVDFAQTWSCYKGGARHCGVCGTCVERREAFIDAGITDPTEYAYTGPLPEAPGDQ